MVKHTKHGIFKAKHAIQTCFKTYVQKLLMRPWDQIPVSSYTRWLVCLHAYSGNWNYHDQFLLLGRGLLTMQWLHMPDDAPDHHGDNSALLYLLYSDTAYP